MSIACSFCASENKAVEQSRPRLAGRLACVSTCRLMGSEALPTPAVALRLSMFFAIGPGVPQKLAGARFASPQARACRRSATVRFSCKASSCYSLGGGAEESDCGRSIGSTVNACRRSATVRL